jgi:hypothetical protein
MTNDKRYVSDKSFGIPAMPREERMNPNKERSGVDHDKSAACHGGAVDADESTMTAASLEDLKPAAKVNSKVHAKEEPHPSPVFVARGVSLSKWLCGLYSDQMTTLQFS